MLFFGLGVLSTLLGLGLIQLNVKHRFKWHAWLLTVTASFLTIFTIAWSVSSVLEGETQAANMGLVTFGLPALILFGVTRKVLHAKSNNK